MAGLVVTPSGVSSPTEELIDPNQFIPHEVAILRCVLAAGSKGVTAYEVNRSNECTNFPATSNGFLTALAINQFVAIANAVRPASYKITDKGRRAIEIIDAAASAPVLPDLEMPFILTACGVRLDKAVPPVVFWRDASWRTLSCLVIASNLSDDQQVIPRAVPLQGTAVENSFNWSSALPAQLVLVHSNFSTFDDVLAIVGLAARLYRTMQDTKLSVVNLDLQVIPRDRTLAWRTPAVLRITAERDGNNAPTFGVAVLEATNGGAADWVKAAHSRSAYARVVYDAIRDLAAYDAPPEPAGLL